MGHPTADDEPNSFVPSNLSGVLSDPEQTPTVADSGVDGPFLYLCEDEDCPELVRVGPHQHFCHKPKPLLTFARFSQVNRERCQLWHSGFPAQDETGWSGADWSNASMGEIGELLEALGRIVQLGNTVKKLRRQETTPGAGAVDPEYEVLRQRLGKEIADAWIYLDLLAQFYNLVAEVIIADKFNEISERESLPQRL